MDLDKQGNNKKIGILGGTFDPAHKGHLSISKEAKKRFDIDKIIWANSWLHNGYRSGFCSTEYYVQRSIFKIGRNRDFESFGF